MNPDVSLSKWVLLCFQTSTNEREAARRWLSKFPSRSNTSDVYSRTGWEDVLGSFLAHLASDHALHEHPQ